MAQSSRQRTKLHKRIGKAVQQRTNAIVLANLKSVQSSDKPVPFGPVSNRGGCSRERLKGGSYGVGFQGPRGYGSPKGLVGRMEGDGGKLAPSIYHRVTGSASKRFALDGDRTDAMTHETVKKRKGKGRWKTLNLNDK